jgi:FkbM family methyltransferase
MKLIKLIIAYVICSDFFGNLIGFLFQNKIPFRGFNIVTKSNYIKASTKAMLFWEMYESAEIRFISKYLSSDDNVIELGASLGVVSGIIGSIIGEKGNCISVEANPNLISIINDNLHANKINNVKVINSAIDYSFNINGYSVFNISDDHLSSSLKSTDKNTTPVFVVSSKLDTIFALLNVNKPVLISDIEGAEIGFILFEKMLSTHFKYLIIELHDVVFEEKNYFVADMVSIIISKHKFMLLEFYGNVFVFKSVI